MHGRWIGRERSAVNTTVTPSLSWRLERNSKRKKGQWGKTELSTFWDKGKVDGWKVERQTEKGYVIQQEIGSPIHFMASLYDWRTDFLPPIIFEKWFATFGSVVKENAKICRVLDEMYARNTIPVNQVDNAYTIFGFTAICSRRRCVVVIYCAESDIKDSFSCLPRPMCFVQMKRMWALWAPGSDI